MRLIIPIFLFLTLATPAAAQEEEAIFPFPYRLVELENGFKAYLIDAGGPGQVAFVTVVRTGSRDEWEPGHSGYAHLFEHMMFRGTERFPGSVYDEILTRIGADSNAFTSSDVTCYYLVTASDALEQVVELESDRFINLSYAEPEYRKETGAVRGEFYQGRANPYSVLYETLRDTAFDAHTYKHTTIGFEADVLAMPEEFEYSLSFFRRYYRPENCVLLLAGDFDADAAEALLRRYYSDWEPGYTPPEITAEPPQEDPREAAATFSGRTLPWLAVAYKAPAWSATCREAVSCQILGRIAFGSNSDIYRRLVLQEQRVQALFEDFGLQRDPYLASVTAIVTNPADVAGVRGEIEATAARFRDQLCDAELLENTKRRMRYEFLMGLETARGVAFSLLAEVVNTGGIEAVEDYYRTVALITPEDIRNAARSFLVDEAKTVVTLTTATEEGGR